MVPPPAHAFRFGLNVWEASTAGQWRDFARKAEDLGYSTLLVPDHVVAQSLAPIAAIAIAAAHTNQLRVGSILFSNDFRHPAILAKEAATIDLLSDGRMELGIGAGWGAADYKYVNLSFDPGRERVARLTEAVSVIKALFAGSPVEFNGVYYKVGNGMEGLPVPVQRPHPPILIGGGGRQILSLAGREANIIGLNNMKRNTDDPTKPPRSGVSEEEAARQLAWIREAAGERFSSLEVSTMVFAAMVTNDDVGIASGLTPALATVREEADKEIRALVGTVDQIVDTCQRRRETLGLNYLIFPGSAIDAMAPVVARLAGT